MNILNKIPNIALIVMLAISVIVALMFFLGGDVNPDAEYVEPNFTGALLNWAYVLVGLVAVVTVIAALVGFYNSVSSDPKSAMVSLGGILVLAALLGITYMSADSTPLPLVNDTEQTEFDLRLAGMCIGSAFILAAIASFVSMFGFLAKRF